MTVAELAASREILICTGPGGVGKTTMAAAIGLMAARHQDGRVLVLTVDPARRLATAMGINAFGNAERRVELDRAGRGEQRGELWAAMLDTKASWDDLVRRHAPDAKTIKAILANPMYRNVTGTFIASHDYIAMERLYELHSSGRYDLIVVDTPPARHALDFLEAPERMADFFSSRLLRWLISGRPRLTSASRPFTMLADRILGGAFVSDLTDFFVLFQSMHDDFVDRARAIEQVLSDRRTAFIVISTPEPGPARDAAALIGELGRRRLELGAVVVNRVLPDAVRDLVGADVATRLAAAPDKVAERLATVIELDATDRARLETVLAEMADAYLRLAVVGERERQHRLSLAAVAPAVETVPLERTDIANLAMLDRLGSSLWR